MKDLVVRAADKDLKFAVATLLEKRTEALGIRRITCDILVDDRHDASCCREGVRFLNAFVKQYRHALLMFDYEGCGKERLSSAAEIESEINSQFLGVPWESRAKAIVLQPELENWVWSDSPHVSRIVGWNDAQSSLTNWLIQEGRLAQGQAKPPRPKEAFDAALYAAGQPHSASLFGRLAENVSFRRCTDPSFDKFCQILREWFPRED